MDNNVISFLVGYIIVINIVSISLIWLCAKTNFIKLSEKTLGIIFVLISAIGGCVGILLGSEMMNYKQDSKLFKRWIPLIIFIEVCIILYSVYNKIK